MHKAALLQIKGECVNKSHQLIFARYRSQLDPDKQHLLLARVSSVMAKNLLALSFPGGQVLAVVGGALQHAAASPLDLPAVGDMVLAQWEADDKAVVVEVLPRRSILQRRSVGRQTVPQLIAANIDTVFVVTSFAGDFNLRRLERYVLAVLASHIQCVILVNKCDLVDDPVDMLSDFSAVLGRVPIHPTSAVSREGLDGIECHVNPGDTICFIGSSGVGKSSLLNALAGEELMETAPLRRELTKGRHTTTMRQMLYLPSGLTVIDTPGMREFAPWITDESCVDMAFEDIALAATRCRYDDCSHTVEPDCAVVQGVEDGEIYEERVEAYRELIEEIRELNQQRTLRGIAKQDHERRGRTRQHKKKKGYSSR
ncbi:ribosome small subunit-dependent GTPase A [Desulfurispira natronophila]|uniref:Small ribosomal subunit biogenesis GTPase RsgA n=1 Tax=Desulfurispira natronophila TaxID=682562 RepID=A0A7W7Y5X4_9BACT|nr:ribosome small subunit-dependent GTPase A [Desulfurispira natronophila]MBB5022691.1 ribosome biogenesis GTPase [Desulfurispira natronophila]